MTRLVEPLLEELRRLILRMASLSEAILEKSLRAVRERDPALGTEVQKDDVEIDRLDVAVDEAVLKVLALQAPVADELRNVFAIKTMGTDLERVGDLARNIGESAVRLAARPRVELPPKLEEMGDETRRMLRMALDSFSEGDCTKARAVLDADERIDELEDQIVLDAIAELESEHAKAPQCVDIILIAKNLERVADHATNIAEDVILVAEARNVKHAKKLGG